MFFTLCFNMLNTMCKLKIKSSASNHISISLAMHTCNIYFVSLMYIYLMGLFKGLQLLPSCYENHKICMKVKRGCHSTHMPVRRTVQSHSCLTDTSYSQIKSATFVSQHHNLSPKVVFSSYVCRSRSILVQVHIEQREYTPYMRPHDTIHPP